MDYIGSKEKINKWIFSHISENIEPKNEVFLDACAGSGSVSKYAAKVGFGKIISNDIMEFPSHIVRGSISLPKSKLGKAIILIDQMNKLSGIEGFFFHNYSEHAGRLFFTDSNAQKIDACRQFIENNVSDIYIKSYLLYCLLEAFSAVSNCTGIHAAFLKKYKNRATKKLLIRQQPSLHLTGILKIVNKDILSLLKSSSKLRKNLIETQTYIDPPYNHRQYGPNYHLYETLIKYDNPTITGKVGLRDWKNESKSLFCSKGKCASFTKEIVDNTIAKSIYISYNSDGLLSKDDFMDTFSGYNIKLFTMPQKRYKSDSSEEREYNQTDLFEYLFKINK
jgi:adenine-specific DNA-methyltransferase